MAQQIKQQFIQDYGEAYQHFGLPKLMGRIVGLLLFIDSPVSLDDITQELNVSKGPVSQIVNRLREHNLVERVWVPGDRKDYYKPHRNIFSNAFHNHMMAQKKNLELAKRYQELIACDDAAELSGFCRNIAEMREFYEKMQEAYQKFLDEWLSRTRE